MVERGGQVRHLGPPSERLNPSDIKSFGEVSKVYGNSAVIVHFLYAVRTFICRLEFLL